MARALLKMQRRQVAKDQSIRWKRDLRHLAAEEVSVALQEQRQYRVRPQAHEIGSILESVLFWLSFIFFRIIQIISAAAQEAFRKEAEDLPRRTTVSQNRRTYRDPAVVEDNNSVLSQEDPPSGFKKQAPSNSNAAVQVDQPQYVAVKVPPGQLSGTPSVKTTAIQADQPQQLPI